MEEKIDWDTVGLGMRPDQEIVRELGIHFNRVGKERRKRNIPMYGSIDWSEVSLGQKPDTAIAKELGMTRERVKEARKKLGISAFTGLILLQENIPCRSIYEAMYDAYLHWKEILHKHEVKIQETRYIADIQLDDRYVEIAGMLQFKKYREKYEKKRAELKEKQIPVEWLTIEDVEKLYENCPIEVKFRVLRKCIECGKEEKRILKGYCSSCYMKVWHSQDVYTSVCEKCGKSFTHHDDDHPKFCSRKCYWKSLEFDWPAWEWIDEQREHMSIRQLAIKMNVKYTALYMRIRRRNKRENLQKH